MSFLLKLQLALTVSFLLVPNAISISTEKLSNKKPHIILIVADDLGWNDVSWNNPNVVTPYMNDLATNGVILNQAYVQPRCTPSRAALMSGQYPFKLGLQHGVISPNEPTGLPLRVKMLPNLLKKQGYSTHAIGKWHLGFCSWKYTPLKRGFDTFYGFYCGSQDYYSHSRHSKINPGYGKLFGNRNNNKKSRQRMYLDLRNNTETDNSKKGIYSSYLFASEAERILKSRNPRNPMFLYLPFQSVHTPLQAPKNYTRIYRHIENKYRRVYLGMVTAMDEAIGRVVRALKDTGHYKNSVIIFTSDNGGSVKQGASNWPLRGVKSTLWEGGMRSPTFIHSPYLPNPGTVYKKLHHITDWYSTIVKIAGGSISKVDGVNQWDALAGMTDDAPRIKVILNMDNTRKYKAAVRFNDFKMLVGGMALTSWTSSPPSKDDPKARKIDIAQFIPFSNDSTSASSPEEDIASESSLPEENSLFLDYNEDESEEESDVCLMGNSSSSSHYSARIGYPTLIKEKDMEFILWPDLRDNKKLDWDPEVLSTFNVYLNYTTKLRLYNVVDDPEERTNLSGKHDYIFRLQLMLNYLSRQLKHYKPSVNRKESIRSHPAHFRNLWSPGWCTARW